MEGIIGRRVLSDIIIPFCGFQSQEKFYIHSMHMLLKLDFSPIIWYLSNFIQVRLLVRKNILNKYILGDSPTSHSRSYQLPMPLPCRQQAAPGGQNVIGGPWPLYCKSGCWLTLCPLSPRILISFKEEKSS